MLARIQRQLRGADVLGMRGGDVDDVDVGVGHQRFITATRGRDAQGLGEAVCTGLTARADGRDGVARQDKILGEQVCDPACRQYPPAYLRRHLASP